MKAIVTLGNSYWTTEMDFQYFQGAARRMAGGRSPFLWNEHPSGKAPDNILRENGYLIDFWDHVADKCFAFKKAQGALSG